MASLDTTVVRIRVSGTKPTMSEAVLRERIDRYMAEMAGLAKANARRNAHVITGEMRDSVYELQLGWAHYKVATDCEHSWYEEFGVHSGHAPRPAHPWFFKSGRQAARTQREKGLPA